MSGIGKGLYRSVKFSTDGRLFSRLGPSCLLTEFCVHASSKQKESTMKDVIRPSLASSMAYARRPSIRSPLRTHFHGRSYSSHSGSNQDKLQNAVSTAASGNASTNEASNAVGNEWFDTLKDTTLLAGKKAKEVSDQVFLKVSDEVIPSVQEFYGSHPSLEKVLVPVGGTLSAAILAWFVMPGVLRRLHVYAAKSPFSVLPGISPKEQVPYERSVWHALEDPARYLVTFLAFSQLAVVIAPSALVYYPQVWRGAIVLSFVWFLQRWKTNLLSSAMANRVTAGTDSENLLFIEKMSSVGLFVLGAMALAETCGVPIQSILAVGGIGGVATAFASKDILGNLFSGISLQFSKPFSIGDYIKAGSVEGNVVEMGLTTTSLLSPDLVIVPNSLFSSQVIINRSRAKWRPNVIRIPVRIDGLDKIPIVSEVIRNMLRANANVFLGKDAPYCYTSRIDNSCAEITLGCNLRKMKKDEMFATQEEILQQAVRIIKEHGLELGGP